MSFSIKQVGNRVILKSLKDPQCVGDVVGFLVAYEKKMRELQHTKQRVVILMDISSLKLSPTNPKLEIIDTLNNFFGKLQQVSEEVLIASATVVSQKIVRDAIEAGMRSSDGNVPARCFVDPENAKQFLKKFIVVKR